MQGFEVGAIAVIVVGMGVLVALRAPAVETAADWTMRVAVGAAVGLTGALVILTSRLDLVPDDLEPVLIPGFAIAVSLAMAFITWRRLSER